MTRNSEKKNIIGPVAEEYREHLRQRKSELGKLPPKEERVATRKRLRKELGEQKSELEHLVTEIMANGFRNDVVTEKANEIYDGGEYPTDDNAINRVLTIRTELQGLIQQDKNFSDIQKVVALALSDILIEQDAAELSRATYMTALHVIENRTMLAVTEFFRAQPADFNMRIEDIRSWRYQNEEYGTYETTKEISREWGEYVPKCEVEDIFNALKFIFFSEISSIKGTETPALIRRDFLTLIRLCAAHPALARHIFNVPPSPGQIDVFIAQATKKSGRELSLSHLYDNMAYLPDKVSQALIDTRVGDCAYFSRIFPPIQRYLARRVLLESGTKKDLFQELFELNHSIRDLWSNVQAISSLKSLFDNRYRENSESFKQQYDDAVARRDEVYKQLQSLHSRPVTRIILDSMADEQAIYRPRSS